MGDTRTSGNRRAVVAQVVGLLALAVVMASLLHLARERQQRAVEVARTAPTSTYVLENGTQENGTREDEAQGGNGEAARPTAVFLGDSYTQGRGASVQTLRWTSLVARERSWQEINLGRGGTGYVSTAGFSGCGLDVCPAVPTMVADAVAEQPDIVVVAGGQNDLPAYEDDPEAVEAAITSTFADLRRQLPQARIVAVGPSTAGEVGPAVTGMDATVRAAAAGAGAQYVTLLEPAVLDPTMLLADGAHVDDAGHRAIADRVLATVP